MVMKEKKLLEAAGYEVKWSDYLNGANAMQDMTSGALDFACCGVVPIMNTHAQGILRLAIIAGANQEGASLVVNGSIKSIGDLSNKKIATPGKASIQYALLSKLAAEQNITIRDQTVPVPDMPRFLKEGEIDGFFAWAPHPANAVEQNLGHELLSSHEILPGHQCCVLVATEDSLQNDSETVNKVLEVYYDAYKWFLNNQDESIKMISKSVGVTESIVRKAIATVKYPEQPYCDVDSMQRIFEVMIENDIITTIKPDGMPTFLGSLYRPELLDAILAK
jgi:NitT/TauT family transport system substrate-binding protein